MKALKHVSLYLLIGISVFSGCASQQRSAQSLLPASAYTTAEPIAHPGLPNFYKVSDTLYRSALPEREGFLYADQLGIKTVVDLCLFHSDEDELEGTGIKYVGIPMAPWHPRVSQLREFLAVATDPANQPVLLHCKRGADRTGCFVAAYRMIVEGWSTEDAIQEMTEGPFDFHEFWAGLPRFLRKLDVETLRAEFQSQAPQTASATETR